MSSSSSSSNTVELDSTGAGAVYRQFLFSAYKSKSSPISPSRECIKHSLAASMTSGLKVAIPPVSILADHENTILSRNQGIVNASNVLRENTGMIKILPASDQC
jgi:hypothetical protein